MFYIIMGFVLICIGAVTFVVPFLVSGINAPPFLIVGSILVICGVLVMFADDDI